MSFNYTRIKAKTQKLIKKFGAEYTFSRVSQGSFDPTTGKTTNTTSTYSKQACIFDYNDADRADGVVQQGDRRLLAEGHTYENGDTVVIDGDTYTIINVSFTAPGGEVVAANLQVRK